MPTSFNPRPDVMCCSQARDTLWPPDRPRLVDADVSSARAHVNACEACRDYFAQDRDLLATFQRLGDQRAPTGVRERIFAALAEERETRVGTSGVSYARALRSGWTWVAGAAAVILAFALAGTGPRPIMQRTSAQESEAYIEDYMRRAVAQERIETSDPSAVTRFLTRELGMAVQPLQIEGFKLAGAETCLLGGRRGAMVIYERNGETLSHYVLPATEETSRTPTLVEDAESEHAEPALVTWVDGSAEQALVASVQPEELLAIAWRAARR